jgi:hypothetical protein
MLLGAPPLALMPCPSGIVDVSNPVVFKVFKLDCETVVVSGKSTENWLFKIEAVLAPGEDEVLKVLATGDNVSV